MQGMCAITGKLISGAEYLRQCLWDVLATPLGTCCMMRGYGSGLFGLVDAPLNEETKSKIQKATASAIGRWLKWFELESVKNVFVGDGQVSIDITGKDLSTGETIRTAVGVRP